MFKNKIKNRQCVNVSPPPPPGYGLPAPTIGHHSNIIPPKTKMRKGFRLQVKRRQTNIFLRFIHSSLYQAPTLGSITLQAETQKWEGERSGPRAQTFPPVGPAPSEGSPSCTCAGLPCAGWGDRGHGKKRGGRPRRHVHGSHMAAHPPPSGQWSCQGRKSSMTTRVSLIICCRWLAVVPMVQLHM